MLVHVVHREHTLSLLRMQSLYRGALVSDLPHGVRQEGLVVDRQGTAELHGASNHAWDMVVHGQKDLLSF